MPDTTTNPENPHSATPEEIWAILRENAEQLRLLREQSKETDRKMEETDRKMKETDRQIGKLGNRFGDMIEHLVAPNMVEKFNELGFVFTKAHQNSKIYDGSNNTIAEIDIFLENDDTVIVVSVKAKLVKDDVDDHIHQMEVLRGYADAHQDTRKYYGAIAAAIMNDALRSYVLKTGFFVIEQTGDTVKINIPEDFKPREW